MSVTLDTNVYVSALNFGGRALRLLTMAQAGALQIVDDPDDNKIIECAVTAGSECIVTEDKALLRIAVYDGITVMSVNDFIIQRASG